MALSMILLLVFVGTLGLMVGGWAFVNRRRLAAVTALRQRLEPVTVAGNTVSILRDNRTSQLDFLNNLLEGKGLTVRLATQIQKAGSSQTVGAFVLLSLLAGCIGGLLGTRLGLVGVIVFAGIGTFLPFANLKRKSTARRKRFEEQLPEALDMLVNAMKAGYSLQAAMKFIGDEMSDPVGTEFTRFYDEQRLGIDVRSALLGMQERVESLDVKMFVTALLIQRESGGNLAEIVTNLSTLMRERAAIRGQIDTLTAEPKASALVLTALPIVMFLLLSWMNPAYMSPLVTTGSGRLLMVYAVVSMLVGYLVMRNIADIDI